jgi:hypothetical protein
MGTNIGRAGWAALACVMLAARPLRAEEPLGRVEANRPVEWSFTSSKAYADPFLDVELDVVVSDPQGRSLRVPAFWAGGQTWRARYASATPGAHHYRTECSDAGNSSLHGVRGRVEVEPYRGENPLYRHGPVRVAADRRHFEHADGTPFLWLGDTWWMALCRRLTWPEEFQELAADRRAKGFNVIQIVAGLYPDMPAFDDRGRNEAGFPWEAGYARINPAYFDQADRRLAWLVESGLTPCIVGAWGYHLPWLGVDRMKRHWRYLVARYGAWPVIWCIAGEGTMPFYLSTTKEKDQAFQRKGWTEVAAYVRRVDPFHRLVTIHPSASSRQTVDDVSVLDFDMLQTGHGDRASIPRTIRSVLGSRAAWPPLPVVNGEVCYEGILNRCFADVQRFMAWSCLLSGAAGHTYGANGIWQLNRRDQPYGASPHGGNWGTTPWDEAMRRPGSRQVGLARRLLERYPWPRFEPHPEWVVVSQEPGPRPVVDRDRAEYETPYAAGLAGAVRIVYLPRAERVAVAKLEPGVAYQARYFDPVTGAESDLGRARPDPRGAWPAPEPPNRDHDWVLVLEARTPAQPRDDERPDPITIHPENPRYFQFRGRPRVLITATEHYGSVVNRLFDFDRYLADAAAKKQTLTRLFLLYREQQTSRNPYSPLKPESPDYVTPYPRTGPGKARDGEPIYDLDRWNPEFFERLHRFLTRASDLGVAVEVTLFSNTYGPTAWALNPLHAANNRQGVGKVEWPDYTTLKDRALVERQMAYVEKIIRETSRYDNIYYEVCNEPGGGVAGHASPAEVDAWQAEVARVARAELARLSRRHLVVGAQAFRYAPTFLQELDGSFASATFDAVNVHPLPDLTLGGRTYNLGNFMSKELMLAEFRDFCLAAQRMGKPCVLDEDNCASLYLDDAGWTIHRKRAWMGVFCGLHYDFIDFSINVGREAGTAESNRKIRSWMRHLSEFIHSFDFIHAQPAPGWIERKPEDLVAAALARAGSDYVAYLADGRELADPGAGRPIGGPVAFHLPEGVYRVAVFAPEEGVGSPGVSVRGGADAITLDLPPFRHDIVVRATRSSPPSSTEATGSEARPAQP